MRLTIGVVGERRPKKAVLELLLKVMKGLGERNDAIGDVTASQCSTNAVFFVPGRIVPIDFEDIEVGFLNKQEKMIRCNIAVPAEFDAIQDAAEFILNAIRLVLETATERFEGAGILCDDRERSNDEILAEVRYLLDWS